ncbi:hypothetical protein ASF70_07475 [Rhizobium sp. Leaf321]|uniref:hypothetical protein n=1 Tax=Rhizobium sp. Leaf321 TaxID=1736335 RepID=UPI000714E310|nr:hypothetical protein [Rhizobium sp. Leaf321]KQQ73643.1 hypothetical protein ASF70_07475 [Rhizobium sp. Leaf321]
MDFLRLQAALANLCPEDKLTATIAHWHEPAAKKGPGAAPLAACSYAIAILVNGNVRWTMWGTGYAPEAIPPVVYGIETLLKAIPQGRRIEVHALAQLHDYIKLGGIGYHAMLNEGRAKSGKPLDIYPAVVNIIQATPARWSLCPHKTMQEAPGFAAAIAVARGTARADALQHKADHAPTSESYPKPVILQEFVDVYPG